MAKLIALDLDSTIAKINHKILPMTLKLLKELSDNDNDIMIISGKPTIYLSGLFRQANISNIILSGENGLEVYFGHELPPRKYYNFTLKSNTVEAILNEKGRITNKIKSFSSNIYFQPNNLTITPFFENDKIKGELLHYVNHEFKSDFYDYFIHKDSIDFSPKGINKGRALQFVANELDYSSQDIIAIGDSYNDIAMFDITENSYIVGKRLGYQSKYKFTKINDVLRYIINNEL